jgi:hypothetical protein
MSHPVSRWGASALPWSRTEQQIARIEATIAVHDPSQRLAARLDLTLAGADSLLMSAHPAEERAAERPACAHPCVLPPVKPFESGLWWISAVGRLQSYLPSPTAVAGQSR